MEIFPAIDIIGGNVVRLTKGDYDSVKKYAESPLDALRDFKTKGAKCLHIVDLDGAKHGTLANLEVIRKLAAEDGIFTEVGGGIRDEEKIKAYLDAGIGRVILGTVAVKDFDFTKRMIEKYGDKIVVGVDAKDGMVAVGGWIEKTELPAVEFCKTLAEAGCKTVIFTDISRDGMLSGCNLPLYKELCQIEGLGIVASGGVTTVSEIKELAAMGCAGAIVGKAIYEGKLTLEEALAAV